MNDVIDINSERTRTNVRQIEGDDLIYTNSRKHANRIIDDDTSEPGLVTTSIDIPNVDCNLFDDEFNSDNLFNDQPNSLSDEEEYESETHETTHNSNIVASDSLGGPGDSILDDDAEDNLGTVNSEALANILDETNVLTENGSEISDNLDAVQVLGGNVEDVMTESGEENTCITISDDECEIAQVVNTEPNSENSVNTFNNINGSLMNPISVEDTYDRLVCDNNISYYNGMYGYDQNMSHRYLEFANQAPSMNDDDCIMGPIHWVSDRKRNYPRDYYNNRTNKRTVCTYKILDNEAGSSDISKILEDVEFLFKCPICYSTITRFKSGKIPNDNDRVIYSTKCGHLFCYECIENVRARKECSICRKPVKDQSQYHIVFP